MKSQYFFVSITEALFACKPRLTHESAASQRTFSSAPTVTGMWKVPPAAL